MGFKRQLLAVLAVVAGFAAGFSAVTRSQQPLLYRISRAEFLKHYNEIREAGIDVAGMNIANQTVDLIVGRSERMSLSASGLSTMKVMQLNAAAPDAKFKTAEKVSTILRDYETKYPNLAKVLTAGRSLQNREIVALQITNGDPAGKPAVFFNGMHHAREVMSSEVPLDIAEYLLSRYGQDPQVTNWLDKAVIYVMPMLNVDGSNIVWTKDNWWRKNARGSYGVDINRNYPYRWNSCNGSSDYQNAQDYHGPSAASEPETQVMMTFVKAIRPVASISFHSYSEIVIYPYGCGDHTERADVVEPLGKQLASLIKTDDGRGTYTAGLAPELLYTVDGGDIDWLYHEGHVIPFVIEVNSDSQGFQPNYNQWRDNTVSRIRPAWQFLIDRVLASGIRGSLSSPSSESVSGTVSVAGTNGFKQSYPIHGDGSFHAMLNPGTYQVRIELDGQEAKERTIRVGDRLVSVDLN